MTKLLLKMFVRGDVKEASNRRKVGYVGSFTGIAVNVMLFLGKLLAGLVAGSISVMADAFNNLSDAGSSLLTFVGFKFAGRPADREHPFGHGRMEYVTGLIISFIIMMMGFELAKSSVSDIIHAEKTAFSALAFAILLISVAVKLWLFFFYRRLGRLINSGTLTAAAMDSLSDTVSTAAVIISMLIAKFAGINTDGYAGVLVSLFIMYTGVMTFRDSLTPLLGTRPDRQLVCEIRDRVMSYPDIIGVHDLLVHDYGAGNMMISLHAEIPIAMSFAQAHDLVDVIEDDLKAEYKCSVTIHIDPIADTDEETMRLKAVCEGVVKELGEELSIHDFRIVKGTSHINMLFDVVVPYDFGYTNSETAELVKAKLKEIDEKYFAVINVENDMSM